MPTPLSATLAKYPIGSYLTGKLAADTNYLRCNASRYLVSAYPDISALISSGQLVTNYEMSEQYTNAITPCFASQFPMGWLVDGNRILFASRNSTDVSLIARSDDGGVTWTNVVKKSLLAAGLNVSSANDIKIHTFTKTGTNSYCAVVTEGGGSTPFFYVITTSDAFDNWTIVRKLGQAAGVNWPAASLRPRIVDGPDFNKFLIIHPTATSPKIWLTLNGGVSFNEVNGTGATWSDAAIQNLECDGTNIFYAYGTTLRYTPFPTTTTPPAFTSVTSKFTNSTKIKKLANRYVAWDSNVSTCTVNTSTTLTGTYTAQTWTGFGNITDIIDVSTKWFAIGYVTASARYNLIHTSDAVSPAIPVERTFASPALNTSHAVVEYEFPKRYGTGVNSCMFVHSAYDITSTTNGTTFTSVYRHKPRTNYGIIKKYGYYFAESNHNSDQNYYTSTTDMGMIQNGGGNRIVYRSVDMINWEPLLYTRSNIIDLGTRLYALVGTGTTATGIQSTDGVNWNTTGITEPAGMISVQNYTKVHACNGLLFRYALASSPEAAEYFVSSNQGLSWTSVSVLVQGFNQPVELYFYQSLFGNGTMAFFKGRYYQLVSIFDAVGYNHWMFRLGVSTNGTTWTFPLANMGNWTGLPNQTNAGRSRLPIIVSIGNYLYFDPGAGSSSNSIKNLYRSQDGLTWEQYDSVLPDAVSALVDNSLNFATENGPDVYFVVRSASPYQVYKNGTLLPHPIVGMASIPGMQVLDDTSDVWSISDTAITRHPKSNITFTTPNVGVSETFMRVK